ncbi:MAG: ABC transporter ATP-binding protein/permease [Microlunatus sp.]|nr:ABC transporter ATP-binding protein/permease [Microlunatus sp.]
MSSGSSGSAVRCGHGRPQPAGHGERRWVGLAIKESTLAAATQVLFFGVAAVVIGWLVHDALNGTVGIAAITLSLLLVARLKSVSSELRSIISQVASMSRTAGRYLWLVELGQRLAVEQPAETLPERSGLTLHDVAYRYPGADHDALPGVSLELRPGTVLAVVGENGAGKSTLAEVIDGIREPSSGVRRIMLRATAGRCH